MMFRAKSFLFYCAAVTFFVMSFVVLNLLSADIGSERTAKGYGSPLPKVYLKEVPLDHFVGAAMMSGFKNVVADLLWLEADHFWHEGQWHKLLPFYYFITHLQPRFVTAWLTGAWHMAYNVSYQVEHSSDLTRAQREIEAAKWVDRSIAFLKEGLLYNSERYDIYFELGWIYFNKLKDYREALAYFEKAAEYDHPLWVERMLAHAYEKCGRFADAYKTWQKILDESGGKDGPAIRAVERLGKVIK